MGVRRGGEIDQQNVIMHKGYSARKDVYEALLSCHGNKNVSRCTRTAKFKVVASPVINM